MELLLKYLNDDPRAAVKGRAIRDLRYLSGEEWAHLWTVSNVSSVVSFSLDCRIDPVLVGALAALDDLVIHTASVDKFSLHDASAPALRLCERLCYRSDLEAAAAAARLLCSLAARCKRDMHHVEGADLSGEAVMAVEALFILINSGVKDKGGVLKVRTIHEFNCEPFRKRSTSPFSSELPAVRGDPVPRPPGVLRPVRGRGRGDALPVGRSLGLVPPAL